MYVFGASGSDTGRSLSLRGFPLAPFWQGRYSNGPVTVEYLASNLGIPSTKRTNYSVGGATTGRDSNGLGHLDQFDTFNQSLGVAQADPNALYFIDGVSAMNDFAKCGNASCTNTQIALMNSNITTLIKNLAAKGAKHFYLGGAPEGVGKYRKGYNSQLATDASSLSKSLGIDVVFYDYAAFSNKNFIVPDSGISYSTTTPKDGLKNSV